MTAFRRKTSLHGRPMRPLNHPVICDQCGRQRARGNHKKCSKARQLAAQEKQK